jgi:hypothetical protein
LGVVTEVLTITAGGRGGWIHCIADVFLEDVLKLVGDV